MDKQRVCCFTGHRSISDKDLPLLISRLDETIAELVRQGVVFYGSGMALGWDTQAAIAVLRAREANLAVKLIAVLPCANQDERWSTSDRQRYRQLLFAADKVSYVSDKPYHDGCMAARNRHLVEHSGVCVAYMKHGRSGTAQTVRMAQEQGLKIINLAEGLRGG